MLELLGGLSLVTDIGTGSPLEESLKRCLVAARLAKIIGCTDSEVSDVLYTALLQHLGCTAYAHEVARVWGDDIVTTRVMFLSSSGEPADLWRVWVPEVASATGRSKARVLATTADEEIRDQEEALQLAERARDLADIKRPLMLDTLAAAYAEAGKYPQAVEAASEGGYGGDSTVAPVQIGAGEQMMNQALINIYTMLGKCPPETIQ